jgi:hypothetical protein
LVFWGPKHSQGFTPVELPKETAKESKEAAARKKEMATQLAESKKKVHMKVVREQKKAAAAAVAPKPAIAAETEHVFNV